MLVASDTLGKAIHVQQTGNPTTTEKASSPKTPRYLHVDSHWRSYDGAISTHPDTSLGVRATGSGRHPNPRGRRLFAVPHRPSRRAGRPSQSRPPLAVREANHSPEAHSRF